jgi:chaperonin GroEL
MDLAVAEVVEQLKKNAQPVKGKKEINQVATIASNNDATIGKMISEAMEKVGKDGVITVEEGKSAETTVDVVEGMQFDRGFLSPHFVTDLEAMKVVLENPYVLIHEDKIASVKKLIPLLEMISRQKRSLLIVAEDIEGEALATLVVNKMRGILQCAAVKAPGYGDRRKEMLEDVAILTGGKAFFKDLGLDLEKIKQDFLGTAKKVEITSEKTTIISGGGQAADISGRAKLIRKAIEDTESDYDREKLQERLAKLTGGVAQLNVGAATEAEMKERKARVEDALHATRAAIEEGILPGGGVALLRASARLSSLKLGGDEALGAEMVHKALEAPARWIAENAGVNGAVVVRKILEGKGAFGFNAEKLEYGDLIELGIIDPTKVARAALQNASSVVGLLLNAEALIAQAPKKDDDDEEEMGAGGGMGGMPPM